MSSGIPTAGLLYACTVSPPSALGAVPEDAAEKVHHLKDGKGFWNPWDSSPNWNPSTLLVAMGKYVWSLSFILVN